jgi:Cu/Ag efflux protein CusF
MKKALGIIPVLLLVVSAVSVWAADIEGKVQRVDSSDRVIVLDDGTKLWVAEGLAMDNIKEGTKVKVSYEERDGKNIVTTLQVAD